MHNVQYKLYFIVKLKEQFKVNYFPWTLSSLNFLFLQS